MRQKRNIVLAVIAMIMILSLSACGNDKGDVETFVKKMKKVKNLEYETVTYRRHLASAGSKRKLRGETYLRHGKMQLDPKTFSEYYASGTNDVFEDEKIDKSLMKFGSLDFLSMIYKGYSPKPKKFIMGQYFQAKK